MKFAIHKTKGFTEHWIAYCLDKSVPFKEVNCYDNDIIKQLEDCDVLMWHFSHTNAKDFQFAKQLLYSIQASGKKVFPDINTMWHFDDKLGQKYLLESIKAPFVQTYIFYSKKEALQWSELTVFPKVFKLRRGASSANVRLARTKREARKLINQAFGRGFAQYNRLNNLKERWRTYRLGKTTLLNVLKGCARIFHTTDFAKVVGNEKGYVYFQDFIPNNNFDIRIVVIGDRAFGIKRMVRKNDFRASGSGHIIHKKSEISEDCVRIAFELNKKLKTQCIAVDFVFKNDQALIVEISYGFSPQGYYLCEGYWNSDLAWHEGNFNPYGWIIENLL